MRAIHILFTLIITLAACGGAADGPRADAGKTGDKAPVSASVVEPETAAVSQQRYTIVMLGDSLTAGFGLAAKDALPEQIGVVLAGKGYDFEIVNAGVSGDTSAGGLARYDWSVASAKPDMLILALGANDFLNGIPAAKARANLSAIITRAQDAGMTVLLAGVSAGGIAQNDPSIGEYAAIYPDLAVEFNVPLYDDILRGVRNDFAMMQLDGLHPTRAGVQRIAGAMSKFIEPYLPEQEG